MGILFTAAVLTTLIVIIFLSFYIFDIDVHAYLEKIGITVD